MPSRFLFAARPPLRPFLLGSCPRWRCQTCRGAPKRRPNTRRAKVNGCACACVCQSLGERRVGWRRRVKWITAADRHPRSLADATLAVSVFAHVKLIGSTRAHMRVRPCARLPQSPRIFTHPCDRRGGAFLLPTPSRATPAMQTAGAASPLVGKRGERGKEGGVRARAHPRVGWGVGRSRTARASKHETR